MDALLMCGGPGTRLDRGEKPLFEVGGDPMVDRVLDALEASDVEAVTAVTSPHVPATTAHLEGRVPLVETAGDGYVADLTAALDRVDRPVLTVVADLPLLAAEPIDRALEAHADGSLTVCVPTALKEALGVSADTTWAAEGGRGGAGRASGEPGDSGVAERGGDAGRASGERGDPGATERGEAADCAIGAYRDQRAADGHRVSPSGLNVVGEGDDRLAVSYDARLAVNVNRPDDAAVAEVLADGP